MPTCIVVAVYRWLLILAYECKITLMVSHDLSIHKLHEIIMIMYKFKKWMNK